jgi:hypothetical protein
MGLERTLLALASYGKPFVMLGSSGWHCSVDMHVNATGAKFEVKSSHDKASPTEAANECFARMRDILQGFVATVKKLDNSSLAELGVQE